MPDQASDKRSLIIGGALILTAAFLTLFLVLLSMGKLPEGCPSGLWLIDRISCLEPNALGDTFAGAFAPVAFVWLVAAVLLQRSELRAQREELRLTRKEYALSRSEVEAQRAVMEQQVEETRKNVLFIEQQTTALVEERSQARAEAVDGRINGLSVMIAAIVGDIANSPLVTARATGGSSQEAVVGKLKLQAGGMEPFVITRSFSSSVHSALHQYEQRFGASPQNVMLSPNRLAEAQTLAAKVDELADNATPKMQDTLAYHGWVNLSPALSELENYLASKDQGWRDAFASTIFEVGDDGLE